MDELNQFAISKILGSRMQSVGAVGFGNFNSFSATREVQQRLLGFDGDVAEVSFGYKEDAELVKAFEAVRDGAPIDELLWNKDLAAAFAVNCRRLGLEAPQAYLIRRLVNVRKSAPRYRKHGIEISPTTKTEVHPSIVSRYAHVIEFSLVKLRFRYGASIDEILMDPMLGDKFEELAKQIAPSISSADLRLGALYIRKHRGTRKNDLEDMDHLQLADLDAEWKGNSSLAQVDLSGVPSSPGLIELKEDKRYLYISHNVDIHAALSQLHEGGAFQLIANNFWKPKLDAITVLFAAGKKFANASIEKWERKLVYERDPVFNWPIPRRSA